MDRTAAFASTCSSGGQTCLVMALVVLMVHQITSLPTQLREATAISHLSPLSAEESLKTITAKPDKNFPSDPAAILGHHHPEITDGQTQGKRDISHPSSGLKQSLSNIVHEAQNVKFGSKDIEGDTNVISLNSKQIKNNWYDVSHILGNTQHDNGAKLHDVNKRQADSIVQRLLAPCAGNRGSNEAKPSGVRPHNISISEHIVHLSQDAVAASRHVARVRTHYRRVVLGGIRLPANTRVFLQQLGATEVLFEHSSLAEQTLGVVYIRLSQIGRHLSQVLVWHPPTGGATLDTSLEHIVEGSILNLLCGVKVILGSPSMLLEDGFLEETLQQSSLPVPQLRALRYLAVYEVLSKLEEVLGEVGVLLNALALQM